MKYTLDSEIAAALTTLAEQTGAVPVPERGARLMGSRLALIPERGNQVVLH